MIKPVALYFLRMLIIGAAFYALLSLLPSCAKRAPEPMKEAPAEIVLPMNSQFFVQLSPTDGYYLAIVILIGDDVPSTVRVAGIIAETNKRCLADGSGRVSRVKIEYKADIQHTSATYLCEANDEARKSNGNRTSH